MFTKKQAGVIYKAWKTNKIEMTKEDASAMYDFAGYDNAYNDRTAQYAIDRLSLCVEKIFKNDYDGAQQQMNLFIDR